MMNGWSFFTSSTCSKCKHKKNKRHLLCLKHDIQRALEWRAWKGFCKAEWSSLFKHWLMSYFYSTGIHIQSRLHLDLVPAKTECTYCRVLLGNAVKWCNVRGVKGADRAGAGPQHKVVPSTEGCSDDITKHCGWRKFQEKVSIFFFFCCIFSFHVVFQFLWSTSRRQRSKAFSSLCAHSCALSACGWRRDESVNRGRFRSSLSLSEANSIAVITGNLLCHSAAISSNAFISFPIVFTASSSFLIRQHHDFQKSPFSVFHRRRDRSLSQGVSDDKYLFEG